jgi:hypothetical protein
MIQELISTSLPKCLNGNPGFGVAAQTAGMAPNVVQAAAALSGYTHLFPAGHPNNPVALIHIIRNLGGQRRHFVSRVADAGNDYSGRTNRIGHHWIIEEPDDVQKLPCGPAAICVHSSLFRTSYTDKAQELPRGKQIANVSVRADVCKVWQQITGDAGWAAAVAEHIEKGLPVSIVYAPGSVDLVILLQEVFALLSPQIRWRTSFSTYFMKSQEMPSDRIQVKCIVKGSEAEPFARTVPNTLLLNLTQPLGAVPLGKYTETARNGQKADVPPSEVPTSETSVPAVETSNNKTSDIFDIQETFDLVKELTVPKPKTKNPVKSKTIRQNRNPFMLPLIAVSILAVLLLVGVWAVTMKGGKKKPDIASQQPAVEKAVENSVEKQPEGKTEVKPEEKQQEEQPEPKPEENTPKEEPSQKDPAADFIEKLGQLQKQWDNEVSKSDDIEQMNKLQKELQTLLDNSRDAGEQLTQGITLKTSIETKINEVRKAQADKEQLQTALKNLRERKCWDNLALIEDKEENKKIKEFALELKGVTDEVQIDYIPFVRLDEPKGEDGNVKKIEWKQEGQKIEFLFSEDRNKIATFEVKDGKILFQWHAVTDGIEAPYPLSSWGQILNRILLAKLQITIGNEPHKIALWQPVKCNDLDLLSSKGISLYKAPDSNANRDGSNVLPEKKFRCYEGKENLFVSFDEIQVLEGVGKKTKLSVEKNKLTIFNINNTSDKSDNIVWYHWLFSSQEKTNVKLSMEVKKIDEQHKTPLFSKDIKENIQINNFKIYLVKADKNKDIIAKIIDENKEKENKEEEKKEKEEKKKKKEKEKERADEEKKKEKDEGKIKELDKEIQSLNNEITNLDKEIVEKLPKEIEAKHSELKKLKEQLDENLLLLLESQPKK